MNKQEGSVNHKTKNRKFYITAAIPYVNAKPHIGHALEFVQVDTIRRLHELKGVKTLALSGGDENALKNVQAAEKAGVDVQQFVDKNTQIYYELSQKLNVNFAAWQKGSNPKHHEASQKLWKLCEKNGDIYKMRYAGLYCVGCEAFYTEEELNDKGECWEHPGKTLDQVEEENYFFALSKYEAELKKLIQSDTLEIIPKNRKNEALSWLNDGLKDISISRTNERAKNWGVQVPDDSTQRMYVWFDALNIYQSGIGFGWDDKTYQKWWPADVHVIGKGILRFHAIYWIAFLLSAGLAIPRKIMVHDYFTVNGQKMSKTLGNVIDPFGIIDDYGTDALRYYLLAKFSPFTDGDFSFDKIKTTYNSDLANGLGNLVSRVAKLCENSDKEYLLTDDLLIDQEVNKHMLEFRFDLALSVIWAKLTEVDRYLQQEKPWEKEGEELFNILDEAVSWIRQIAYNLTPFLPDTSQKILNHLTSGKIKAIQPLFPRV
jgi:methionyl-tRNA synthetase